jgi:lipoyl(octanoyl) transferase
MSRVNKAAGSALQAYLFGTLDFETALHLQRRLAFQIADDQAQTAVVICEHPPLITVGRQGSRTHLRWERDELAARCWPVRWVSRGGGCVLHVPGQLAIYVMLALDDRHWTITEYLARLHDALRATLKEFGVFAQLDCQSTGLFIESRPIALVGISVRNGITSYGAVLNVNPDLEAFRRIQTGARGHGTMTSLERERRAPVRPSHVRERLLEQLAAHVECSRIALFSEHPSLNRKTRADALPARP